MPVVFECILVTIGSIKNLRNLRDDKSGSIKMIFSIRLIFYFFIRNIDKINSL